MFPSVIYAPLFPDNVKFLFVHECGDVRNEKMHDEMHDEKMHDIQISPNNLVDNNFSWDKNESYANDTQEFDSLGNKKAEVLSYIHVCT